MSLLKQGPSLHFASMLSFYLDFEQQQETDLVVAEGLPSWCVSKAVAQDSPVRSSSDVSLEAELKAGKYGVVRSMLRVLEGGTASKALLDTVIDACK